MVSMLDVFATGADGLERKIGALHEDGRGYVAWDESGAWLGKSENHRFRSAAEALDAIWDRYEARHGKITMRRMAPAA